MNIFTISLANLRFRAGNSFFNTLILALGIAIIITLLHISQQLENRFSRDIQGIDLVVGAKGSPIQLILSSVFHLDVPTGNIPMEEAEKLEKNPLVKSAIPIALGDNYNGFRIVGTTTEYINHYGGKIASGRFYNKEMEVVLGSEVAAKYPAVPGDKILGAHGLTDSEDMHSDSPYEVVGIPAPTGTVLDRLVLTPIESVWHTHEEHHNEGAEEHNEEHEEHEGKEITSLLISYKSPLAAVTLPREINKSSSLQAASPAFELARLLKIVGVGSDAVKAFALVLVGLAGIGFFVTLFNAVNDRKYDIILMRSLGASRKKIFSFVLIDGVTLGLCGAVLGLLFGHGFAYLSSLWIENTRHIQISKTGFSIYELYIMLAAIAISAVAALLPAIAAYKTNISKILSKGV